MHRVADSHKNWSNPGKGSGGYGYLWWLSVSVPRAYAAEGHGGQYIDVDPVHDSIIIVTAEPNLGGNDFEPARTLINHALSVSPALASCAVDARLPSWMTARSVGARRHFPHITA